ncbi:cell surface glycoprotein CD200 receptor 1-B-like isoform X1 [Ambystoma mexicanum]|uniref:cell surface glycoprotein CD200 receptor 1-B-like isoform X1 n=1 Tax=Ambystoma mexicanum TaxID=8296 RepID=UPI0037E864E8
MQHRRNIEIDVFQKSCGILALLAFTSADSVRDTFSTVYATVGHEAALHCSEATQDTITLRSWKINTGKGNTCLLSFSPVGNRTFSNCSKHLSWKHGHQMASRFINPVGLTDEGEYVCETASPSGVFRSHITLNVQVPPEVTLTSDGSAAAVCKAFRGKPAPTISWEPPCETCLAEHHAHLDKTVTAVSRYRSSSENETRVTCVVSHPTFLQRRQLAVVLSNKARGTWGCNPAFSIWFRASLVFILIAIFLGFITYWKYHKLRQCCKHTCSNNPSKCRGQQNPQVEEGGPYANCTPGPDAISI